MGVETVPSPEFSYLLPLDLLGAQARKVTLTVGEAERAALAKRFDLVSLDSLSAALVLRRVPKSPLVRVTGTFSADFVQRCVVTQEPVPAHLDEELAACFGPEEAAILEVEFDPNEEDPPEPFTGDAIELGEWLAQCFAVAMDPYPRAPGAELEALTEEGESGESTTYRPFESLLADRRRKP
jgi:uncharacterized metal-binding protein YceD (DUF177 family)